MQYDTGFYFLLADGTFKNSPPDPYKAERLKAVIITNPHAPQMHLLNGSFRWCGVKETSTFEETVCSLQQALDKQQGMSAFCS